MAKEEKEQFEKTLTIREKMAIHLVIMLIKLIKPFSWAGDVQKTLSTITELMDKKA